MSKQSNKYGSVLIPAQNNEPDDKVHGANMGSIWGQEDPGGSHVGPMNLAIWESSQFSNRCGKFASLFMICFITIFGI